MIVTDLAPPVTSVLGRLSDVRTRQYWDPRHMLAKQMAADARPPQPTQDCCDRDGVPWDLAAVYPKGVTWTDRMPTATLFNGPVEDIEEALASAVTALRAVQ